MSSIQNKSYCQMDSAQISLDGHFSNAIVLRERIAVSILELKVVRKVLPHYTLSSVDISGCFKSAPPPQSSMSVSSGP